MGNRPVIASIFVILLIMLPVLASCGGGAEAPDSGDTADMVQQEEQNLNDAESQQDAAGQEEQNQQKEKEDMEEKEDKEEATEVNTDNITINTQSSIRIDGSKVIYSDPYKRSKAANDADIVFITHAHYDHFDEPSLKNTVKADTIIVCPASMLTDVKSMNISKGEVIGMNAGDTEEVDGITVEAVPAYNLNKNFHPKSNGWVGYIITMDGVRYYAAGDTDALPELEDVECDIAFVPVGGTYTMTATEAAGLVNKIKPAIAIPIHYGTIVGRAADADTFAAGLDDGIKVVKKVEDAR